MEAYVTAALKNPNIEGLANLLEKMRKQIAMDHREMQGKGKLFQDTMTAESRAEEIQEAIKTYNIDLERELYMDRRYWWEVKEGSVRQNPSQSKRFK